MTDFIDNITETASASDVRSFGSFVPNSPGLSYNAGWSQDTTTPDLRRRAFASGVTRVLTFTCSNVPSITMTIQKEYGWGFGDVYVNGVLNGSFNCHDAVGGGFLASVTIPLKTSGSSPSTVTINPRAAKYISFTNLTFDTEAASPGFSVVINRGVNEASASADQIEGGNTTTAEQAEASSPQSQQIAAAFIPPVAIAEPAVPTTSSSSMVVSVGTAPATASVTHGSIMSAVVSIQTSATATALPTGGLNLTASALEIASASFSTVKNMFTSCQAPAVATAEMLPTLNASASVTETVASVETTQWSLDITASASESAIANEGSGVDFVSVMLAAVSAMTSSTSQVTLGGQAIEVAVSREDANGWGRFAASVNSGATATELAQKLKIVDVAALESCLANTTSSLLIKTISGVLSEASPFLTNIPAVFRIVAVRKVDGIEVESEPTVRMWARVGTTSKSNVGGDIFTPQGDRLFPSSGTGKLMLY